MKKSDQYCSCCCPFEYGKRESSKYTQEKKKFKIMLRFHACELLTEELLSDIRHFVSLYFSFLI